MIPQICEQRKRTRSTIRARKKGSLAKSCFFLPRSSSIYIWRKRSTSFLLGKKERVAREFPALSQSRTHSLISPIFSRAHFPRQKSLRSLSIVICYVTLFAKIIDEKKRTSRKKEFFFFFAGQKGLNVPLPLDFCFSFPPKMSHTHDNVAMSRTFGMNFRSCFFTLKMPG